MSGLAHPNEPQQDVLLYMVLFRELHKRTLSSANLLKVTPHDDDGSRLSSHVAMYVAKTRPAAT